jgi:hypothetical protein
VMKKVTAVAGKVGTQMRDRSRSAKLKVLAIARASRNKTEQGRQKMKTAYLKLLDIASRVVGQAKKFSGEIAGSVKQGNLSVLHKAKILNRFCDEAIGETPLQAPRSDHGSRS